MTEVLTIAQMRATEARAMESGAVTGRRLMERAGAGVVAAILARWPEAGRVVVLCGAGNNGGDGFVIARLLQSRRVQVTVLMLGTESRMPPDARANHDLWVEAGGAVLPFGDAMVRLADDAPDLVIDALFGTGLARALSRDIQETLAAIADWCAQHASTKVVAVDVPSGLCADSGRDLGAGLPADLTVTFHRPKLGHYLAEGPRLCGDLVVADIKLPTQTSPGGVVRLTEGSAAALGKGRGHKYDHGHVLVLSGGPGRGGAARLAARGALRIGAGLVTLGCPPEALPENAARLDVVMLRALAGAADLGRFLEDDRINALCLGPGLGTDEAAAALVAQALASGCALVLDADALTVLASRPALAKTLHSTCVLTPHAGEFARLFPVIAARWQDAGPYTKIDACRDAAAQAGCVVLLKGPDTVIATPDGTCALNSGLYDRAAPWLATAGAGDVLAGLIAGLMARGHDPFQAACTGAWLHVGAARAFGPGLIAEDLPETLPQVLRSLGV
jgi:ADP-dependent NAD(P)H-hydrate dehydratase / NAD(P)H-hydrate epimerase